MVPSLDELLARWREDPRPSVPIQLCQAIADGCAAAGPTDAERVAASEIGQAAVAKYPDDVSVLLAVGRMYLSVGELADAHVVILQAAKLPPGDPRTFKLLGELMLRRGDARRALRAFERALTGGIIDAHTRLWYDHAKRLVAVQDANGPGAVCVEMESALPTLLQPPLPFEKV